MSDMNTYGAIDTDGPVAPAPQPAPAPAPAGTSAPQATGISPLDEIVADLESSTLQQLEVWEIPDRPNFQIEFDVYISSDDFKRYQRSASGGATNRKSRRSKQAQSGDVDQFQLSIALVREKSTRIFFKGQPITTTDGDEMTLNHPEFLQMLQRTKLGGDVASIAEAIEVFLGPGYLLQIGESILSEAGYAGSAEPVNP